MYSGLGVKYAITDNLDFDRRLLSLRPARLLVDRSMRRQRRGVAKCHGTFDAVSLVADWQFAKKFDAYAEIMFSQNNGGLADGLPHSQHDRSRWASLSLLRHQ